tara:strand:+ start:360 stop:842 length:483 start_codon:yes stop_codon:yes gene_type:complete
MDDALDITLTVNGIPVTRRVTVRLNLVDFLRHELGLTGSHVGCEHGACGACSVVVDGDVVRGCLMFAVQADRAVVETIEGASENGRIKSLQDAFHDRAALQCGFCTPGMLLTAAALLARDPSPDRKTIRGAISGNLCRCTGYQAIVDAIETVTKSVGNDD